MHYYFDTPVWNANFFIHIVLYLFAFGLRFFFHFSVSLMEECNLSLANFGSRMIVQFKATEAFYLK